MCRKGKKRESLIGKVGMFQNFRPFLDLKAECQISYQSYVLEFMFLCYWVGIITG